MAGAIKIDDKTQKVISADLDIDYGSYLRAIGADAANIVSLDGKVRRTLKSLGLSDSRPLKDSDHKKLAAEKNADALIKDFEKAGTQIYGANIAYGNTVSDVERLETAGVQALFKQGVSQLDVRIKAIEAQLASLNVELDRLETTKKGIIKQIDVATEKPGAEFRKKVWAISQATQKIGAGYTNPNWNFDLTRRYMKKK